MRTSPHGSEQRGRTGRRRGVAVIAVSALAVGPLMVPPSASAISTTTTTSGVAWNVNDARRPGLDTGSIRNVSNSRMEGFGNLFVKVAGSGARMNSQMLRGFGLTETGEDTYVSTASVRLDALQVARRLSIDPATDVATFFDTFTNTSATPMDVSVSFGGSLGYGDPATSPATAATVAATSDADTVIDADDAWVTTTTTNNYRPTGVVLGDAGSTDRLGDQQNDPFTVDYKTSGSASNDPGFVTDLTIEPGATQSLARYVVVGDRGDTTAITTKTQALAEAPDLSGLSLDEICTLENWDLSALSGFDPAACAGAEPLKLPAAPAEPVVKTSQSYDVTGKTIADLQADLEAGDVTSVELTKAYLDRIEAYDSGQLGFHAFITVAKTAVAQAIAADEARADGRTGDLLGIPIAVKDLYDTKDMPTTGGTKALENFQTSGDAWQVAKLREAGAIIIGKTNLSEFANSGSFSESGFKQTWNALYPSKTSFGSSGGSAVAVATDMAAAAMGTQTGVSLYAPSTGASLASFRGTDGLTSTEGVMPLTWGQDYAGPIAKSVTDLASLLDATATQATGNNPDDLLTSRVDNAKRPTEWKSGLTTSALQGKKIGYLESSFASTSVADDTTGAQTLAKVRSVLEAAGAELVPMTGTPSQPPNPGISGSAGAEGWERYIAAHPNFPFSAPKGLLESKLNLPYNVSSNYTSVGMDDENTEKFLQRRDGYKVNAAAWMDSFDVDAVAYPGFLTAMGNNDAASAIFSSDRASGVLTSNVGLPTVILPIGATDEGYSNSLQLVGPAWSDAQVLAMGYAAEQTAQGQVHTSFAPALEWSGPAESTTSLALSDTAVTYGTGVEATVAVASDPAATGDVEVTIDGTTATGTLSGGTATVSLPKRTSVGTHLVVARFAGSAKVGPSEATATLKVTTAAPTVTAAAVKSTVGVGEKPALRVTVSAAELPDSTTLLVKDGSTIIASSEFGASGTGTVALPALAKGLHRLTVTAIAGENLAAGVSRPVTITVAKATSSLAVKVVPTKIVAKKTRAKVLVGVAATSKPTGTVRATYRGKVIATAKVKGGKAVLRLPKLTRGSKKVVLVYAGDANTKASKSVLRLRVR